MITKIEVQSYSVALASAAQDARRTWSERSGLLVTIRDDRGRIGQGEASPLPGYSPDALTDCQSALERLVAEDLSSLGDDDPPTGIAALVRRLLGSLPAAAFAVETALLDLWGQRRACTVAEVLGGADLRRVPLTALIPAASAEEMIASVRQAADRGVRSIKVKVTAGFPEREALMALRREVGDGVAIRLDANGVWDVKEARAHLRAAAEIRPEYVEDPVAPPLWCDLGPVPVPLAADEPLGTADERVALCAAGLRVLVLKPSRLGGLLPALALHHRATRMGLDVVVGHMYEGPVGMAACAELALALERQRLACGLDRHAALAAWEVALPQLHLDRVESSGKAGLGLPALRAPGALPG